MERRLSAISTTDLVNDTRWMKEDQAAITTA